MDNALGTEGPKSHEKRICRSLSNDSSITILGFTINFIFLIFFDGVSIDELPILSLFKCINFEILISSFFQRNTSSRRDSSGILRRDRSIVGGQCGRKLDPLRSLRTLSKSGGKCHWGQGSGSNADCRQWSRRILCSFFRFLRSMSDRACQMPAAGQKITLVSAKKSMLCI